MSSIFQQALLSLEQGNIDRAERQFRSVLQDNPEDAVDVMGYLSEIALMKDNLHSAIRWQKRALILSQEMGELRSEIQISLHLASLYFRKQDYLSAYHWTEEAYKIAEKCWFRQCMAESLVAKARILPYLGRTGNTIKKSNQSIDPYREAILHLRKSRDIFDEIRDLEGYFRSSLQMGKIFYEQQMLPEARKEFLASLRMLSKDEILLAASLHLRIAAICRKEKRDVEGIPHALAALGRYRSLQKTSDMQEYQEAQDGFGNSLHAIGSFYRRVGHDVFWAQLHRVLDPQSFVVVEGLILDYLQTFVEEIGQEHGPEAEAFSQELQQKLEGQDRTEEILAKNNVRSLTQSKAESSKTQPKIGIDRNIEKESSTEMQHPTEIATEIEEFEYTLPRPNSSSVASNVDDHTQISINPPSQSSQEEQNIRTKSLAEIEVQQPSNINLHQTKNRESNKNTPSQENMKTNGQRRGDKETKDTVLSPQKERTSQVNMVIELDDEVQLSLSDEVSKRVEWKEFSKQKDPMPKWKDFLLITVGVAFFLVIILNFIK